MIAAAVLRYIAEQPAPSPVRWVEHPAEHGAFLVEYQLPCGRIVPVRFQAGARPRYLVAYVDAGRITAATRIDAPRAPVRS